MRSSKYYIPGKNSFVPFLILSYEFYYPVFLVTFLKFFKGKTNFKKPVAKLFDFATKNRLLIVSFLLLIFLNPVCAAPGITMSTAQFKMLTMSSGQSKLLDSISTFTSLKAPTLKAPTCW